MLKKISAFALRRHIDKQNKLYPHKFKTWERIERIALIIHEQDQINKTDLLKYIEEIDKHVEIFYLEPESKISSHQEWFCITKKETSVLNLISNKKLLELKEKVFDIVINSCSDNDQLAHSLKCIVCRLQVWYRHLNEYQ